MEAGCVEVTEFPATKEFAAAFNEDGKEANKDGYTEGDATGIPE